VEPIRAGENLFGRGRNAEIKRLQQARKISTRGAISQT
jgi:hypothetical protein